MEFPKCSLAGKDKMNFDKTKLLELVKHFGVTGSSSKFSNSLKHIKKK